VRPSRPIRRSSGPGEDDPVGRDVGRSARRRRRPSPHRSPRTPASTTVRCGDPMGRTYSRKKVEMDTAELERALAKLPIQPNPALVERREASTRGSENRIADRITDFAGRALSTSTSFGRKLDRFRRREENTPGLMTMIVSLEAIFSNVRDDQPETGRRPAEVVVQPGLEDVRERTGRIVR